MPNIVISAEGTEERIQLDAAIVTLGRGLESDVRLKDIKASRRHCQIVKTSDGYKVVDLGSGNGTFLNGVQIKEQRLGPGDKIQIGATVITFEDGAPRPAGTVKATTQQRKPETRSLQKPTATTASKTGTARVPTAAAKSATGTTGKQVKVTGTQAAVTRTTTTAEKRGHTSRIMKTAATPTALSRATTGKMTGAARKTASQRFTADVGKPRKNPITIILGIAGGFVVVTIVLMFLMSGGESPEGIKGRVEKLLADGAKAEDANNYELAIKKYEEALKLIEGNDTYKATIIDIRGRITAARQSSSGVDEANRAWQTFKEEYEKERGTPGVKPYQELLQMAQSLKVQYGTSSLSWLTDLQDRIERLQKMVNEEIAEARRSEFQAYRNELIAKHTLDDKKKAQYGKAIKDMKDYVLRAPSDDARRKAQQQVDQWNNQCKQAVHSARSRLEGLDKPAAAELLKDVLAQVEGGSDYEAEVRELIKKYE